MDSFIDFKKNDKFMDMTKSEQKEFLKRLKSFYLTYQDSLGFPKNVTFGIELEYEDVNLLKTNDFIQNEMGGIAINSYDSFFDKDKWVSKKDASLLTGGEIVSPIMNDDVHYWNDIKTICEFLKQNHANMDRFAASHVHIGSAILDFDYNKLITFIKLFTVYENILFRFGYGDKTSARSSLQFFAVPLALKLNAMRWKFNLVKNIDDLEKILPIQSKHLSLSLEQLNFKDKDNILGNTIEFRFGNGTDEEVVWQNFIRVYGNFLLAIKNNMIDIDYLDYLLNKQEKIFIIDNPSFEMYYSGIHLEKAFMLADTIFNNNLDKIYFLKQYIKDFQNLKGNEPLKLARKFVK